MPSTEPLSDTLSETLDIFASGRGSHAPLTTSEVADSLDCTRQVASERLERLVERGHLETKEVGDREHVWWLAESSGDARRDEGLRTVGDSDRMLARLIENVPGMIYRCRNEPGWPMEFVSDGCRELTGYDSAALERDDVRWGEDVIVEDDREAVWEAFQTALTDRNQFSTTYRIRTADGDLRWVRDHARGMFDEDGDLVAIEGIIYDVTERKRLESELEEVFGRVTDAFYALDEEWRFTHANERAEELIDYQGEGLVGKNFWEVFEWATDSTLGEEYRTAMDSQEPTSFEFYYPEPLEAWYEIHAYPSETGLSVYFRDVTDRVERDRELERSERRYRALVENFPNGAVALVDENLHYRTVGGNPLDVADVTVEEVENSSVEEALPSELADELVPRYEAAMEGESDSFEAEYDDRIFEFQIVPVRDDDGNVFAALGMSQNITERKENKRKLQRSERQYRTLVESFPNGSVALFDEDLCYTAVGGQLLDTLDISPTERLGRSISELHSDDVREEIEPYLRAALEGEENSFEIEYRDRHLSAYTLPVTDDEGDAFAGMLMVRDVTEQKERERYLSDAKSRLEAATEAGAVGTFEWYIPEDRMVTGATFARTFGIDPDAASEGVSLDRFVSAIHEADRERVEREIEEAVETCGEYEAEYRVWNADDELRWVVARGHVECDDDGEPVRFPGALTDITERKRAEQELEEHRKQLETLFEVLPVGVVVADADGHLVEANEAAKELWGGDVFDAEGVGDYDRFQGWWSDTGEPVDPQEWTMSQVIQGEEVTEPDIFQIETVEGERRIIMVHGMPVRDASGEVIRGVVTQTDITERKERERELERALDLLERTERIADVGGWEIDVDTQDVFWTDHIFELLEVPGDEEPPLEDALDMYHEEDQLIVEDAIEDALDSGDPFDVEARIRTDSGETRWLRLQGAPEIVGDDVVSLRGAAQDVTKQVEREQELEETVEQLEESNERLERFASMLAHELRNPVTIGQIYSQQLPDDTDAEAVEYVTEAFDRIESMIDVMLVLTRGREAVGDSSPLSLADVTRDAWEGIDAPDATLEVEVEAVMQADETYVQHMFRNLFENAVEHGSTSHRPRDDNAVDHGSTSNRPKDDDAVQHGRTDVTVRVGELPTGFYVADDGPGIPEDERDVVFEAGYTTAADEGGTGLGLAFVEELADVYGWDCAVTESEDGGARFEFRNVDSVAEE